jgi:TonB family protein
MTMPVAIKRVDPDYLAITPNQHASSLVLLEAEISETGDVRNVRILKDPSNPYSIAAAKALKQWKFRPATLHGRPVAVLYNLSVHIHFR